LLFPAIPTSYAQPPYAFSQAPKLTSSLHHSALVIPSSTAQPLSQTPTAVSRILHLFQAIMSSFQSNPAIRLARTAHTPSS